MKRICLFLLLPTLQFSQDWGWDITSKKEIVYKDNRPQPIYKKLIEYYQEEISPLQGSRCPMYPTCSHYTLECMELYGFYQGLIMGAERIYIRENKGLFKNNIYYDYISIDGKRRIYDIPWANNIFKENIWYLHSSSFNITPNQ